jgi:ribosomal protein L12E/L44/L45/RPP1/RPP2
MKDCGVSVDKESLDHMIKQFEGKTAHEMIKEGSSKVVAMPAGGGKYQCFRFNNFL